MEIKKNKSFKFIIAFLLLLTFIFSPIFNITPLIANAVTVTGYTSVLGDLQIDDTFKKEDYPRNDNDKTTLRLLQIAESTGGELFVYTYQPSAFYKQMELTTITISQYLNNSADYRIYDLKLLDSDGVFAKYKVKGIKLNPDLLRYYGITEIHRKFDTDFGDKQSGNGNTTTEVAINISQEWTATTINGNVSYGLKTLETLIVTAKYVGFIRYKDNDAPSWINKDGVDSHFVAFSLGDYKIDDLLEAEVYYKSQLVETNSDLLVADKYHSIKENYASLKAETEVVIEKNDTIWRTNMHKYNEIQTVNEFFSTTKESIMYEHGIFGQKVTTNLKEETKKNIKNMQYVLRFAITDYDYSSQGVTYPVIKEKFTNIEDVTILSLTFMKDGKIIKLGVIDNKTNGSGIPDSITEVTTSFSEWFVKLLEILGWVLLGVAVVVGLTLLAIFTPFFKVALNVIVKVGKGVGKVLWYIITSPIEFFKWLIKKE